MAVDRLSVTVPSELGAALRALAEQRGETVSTLVSEAIAREVRQAALDVALAEADRRFGQISTQALAKAEAELVRLPKKAKPRRGR
jgi:predicted transcriptional regulator